MKRPSIDEYYLNIAKAVSERSTCLKKWYGAVLVKNGTILSTGYNGSVRGEPHCGSCSKAPGNGDMEEYLSCPAVHAEQNALLAASRNDMIGADLYLAGYDVKTGEAIECSAWPCEICLRLIKNAGIYRIINNKGVIYMRITEDPNSEMIQFIEKKD
jgi:dCMP deaminase